MGTSDFQVIHALPGRVRFRIGPVKGNYALARDVEAKLGEIPGITHAAAADRTGSLLVHYDLEKLCSGDYVKLLEKTLDELFPTIGEFGSLVSTLSCLVEDPGPAAAPAATTGVPWAEQVACSFGALNARIGYITGGIDLKVIVPLALTLLGLRGLWASEKLTAPSWSNLLWFGFATFVMLNRGLVEGRVAEAASEIAD